MLNPWNPSPDEIRQWAYADGVVEPCQDGDLALSWSGHERALLECASDERCPNRSYFVGVLYLIIGDAVRTGFSSKPRPVVEGFVSRGDEYGHADIRRWQQRSRSLLRCPSKFEYEQWCSGVLSLSRWVTDDRA
ncbi:MAG: hypothetical protein JWO31_1269 [Phycisphaerales bacterium]|nr:hypothetical protein [Phycisphaerales bacterium]